MARQSIVELDLGRTAFEAYRKATAGKTWDGVDIPQWEELSGDTKATQDAWLEAAQAVVDVIVNDLRHSLADEYTSGPGSIKP